jgi:hypothetical protein
MKLTKSYLRKVIKEELKGLSEQEAGQPKVKADVKKISQVMEKLPQLQRLFGMINSEDELSQVLDNLISGVSGAKIVSAQLLKKVLLKKAADAGGLAGE